MIHYYTVKVSQNEGGKGGQEGRVATLSEPNNSHFPEIIVQSPGEFKGPVAEDGKSLNWTPEDIYVASAAICFFTTFVAVAEASRLEYLSFSVTAKGKLESVEGIGQMISEIEMKPSVVIKDLAFKNKTQKILEKTEKGCLIANSMKTKIILETNISSD